MEGRKRRPIRSCNMQQRSELDELNKDKTHRSDETETVIISRSVNNEKAIGETSNASVSNSESQPCPSKTETSCSENSNRSKKYPQKRQNCSRKKEMEENDTEKENTKLSKAPCLAKIQRKPNINDRNNNEYNSNIHYKKAASKSSKKPKIDIKSPSPAPLSATGSNKPWALEFEQHQNFPSQQGAVCLMRSNNMYHQYVNTFVGKPLYHTSQPVTRIIAEKLSEYAVADNDQPFKCRITSLEWHPRRQNFIGVGSKHGDISFYKVKRNECNSRLELIQNFSGIGPGGNISCLKFHPTLDNLVYTSSLCGKVSLHDIEGRINEVLLNTRDWNFWYSSLDVHTTDFLVAAGRNKGEVALLDKDGKCIWTKRLHRQKVSHLEFSQRDPYLFCTASLDHSVKLWDLRKVVEKLPMETLVHSRGLNSAYFSLTDRCRLLTTDQNEEIRVYVSPSWTLERAIVHPHRFFQHLTPMKAHWHPHKDIILCGRYPNEATLPQFQNLRSIDMFDANTGQRLGEMYDPAFKGITSLVKMNNEGTKLLSAMGFNLNLWDSEDMNAKESQMKMSLEGGRAKAASNMTTKRPKSSLPSQAKKGDKIFMCEKKLSDKFG